MNISKKNSNGIGLVEMNNNDDDELDNQARLSLWKDVYSLRSPPRVRPNQF